MAFFDGEGRDNERERLGEHLRQCAACQQLFEDIGETVVFGDGALDLVHDVGGRRRLSQTRRWWLPTLGAALIIMGIGAGLHPAGNKAMAAFASLFEVKHIGTVAISPNEVTTLSRTISQGGHVTLKHYGSIKVAGPMQQQTVPLQRLSHYGIPNYWPKALGPVSTAQLKTGLRMTLTLNVPHINQLIQLQGGHDFFPMSINEKLFTLVVPSAATVSSGGWTLEEVPQPSVVVPGQVPIKAIMSAMENLPFLPSNVHAALATMANWKNTLIVPLPGHAQNVSVAGTQGIVDSNSSGTTVGEAWIKNRVVVAVFEHQSHPVNQAAFQKEVAQLFR